MKLAKNTVAKGFSLVEMLVVIAVIGIIAAVAVPNIGRINDSAKDAKMRRNAQNIASIYSSAQAAGYDFSYDNGDPATGTQATDLDTMIPLIITGTTIAEKGPFEGTYFGVPGLDPSVAIDTDKGAAKYLAWDGSANMLVYTGGQEQD